MLCFYSLPKWCIKATPTQALHWSHSTPPVSTGEPWRFFPTLPHFTVRTTAKPGHSPVRQVGWERPSQPHWQVRKRSQGSCVTFPGANYKRGWRVQRLEEVTQVWWGVVTQVTLRGGGKGPSLHRLRTWVSYFTEQGLHLEIQCEYKQGYTVGSISK